MNERNTHFQSFAKLLWEEIESFRDSGALRDMTWDERLIVEQEIIARRAYDFAYHIFDSIPPSFLSEHGDPPDCVKDIPDLTEWPDTQLPRLFD